MGKNGQLLRQQKAQRTVYSFTREQLEAHDRQVAMDAINRKKEDLRAYAKVVLDKDFAERAKLLEGSTEDVTFNVFSMLISISTVVLVRDFGWKPIWKHSTRRNRLSRFVTEITKEAEMIINDELLDIRTYAVKAWDITGVRFEAGEEETNE